MDPTILAYIAGFLDGDGSIFFRLIRKKDYCLGFQVRTSVAFYLGISDVARRESATIRL